MQEDVGGVPTRPRATSESTRRRNCALNRAIPSNIA